MDVLLILDNLVRNTGGGCTRMAMWMGDVLSCWLYV